MAGFCWPYLARTKSSRKSIVASTPPVLCGGCEKVIGYCRKIVRIKPNERPLLSIGCYNRSWQNWIFSKTLAKLSGEMRMRTHVLMIRSRTLYRLSQQKSSLLWVPIDSYKKHYFCFFAPFTLLWCVYDKFGLGSCVSWYCASYLGHLLSTKHKQA